MAPGLTAYYITDHHKLVCKTVNNAVSLIDGSKIYAIGGSLILI